jgi:predicted ribosomally synthesized peptide with nif11-like leader
MRSGVQQLPAVTDLARPGVSHRISPMSKAQLTAFVAKMDADPALKALVDAAVSPQVVVEIAHGKGNTFTAATWSRHLRG